MLLLVINNAILIYKYNIMFNRTYVLIGIFIYILIKIITYESKNKARHLGSSSLYAHFSEVDRMNCVLFPKLIFTHPRYITLKKGQSIYIPPKWWHWIRSSPQTYAVNFWFDNSSSNINKPYTFDNEILIPKNLLKNETIHVWNSINNNMTITNFTKFIESKKDGEYMITLDNFETSKNINIKNILKKYISFPKCPYIKPPKSCDFNVWISSGHHDTGLHYDDEDGILCVIEGEKQITLFPPEDTLYLYPYPVIYKWINPQAYLIKYNTYHVISKIDGISSSQLLYETCKNNKYVCSIISKLYNKHKKLVWGYKKMGDIYRWEFYNYTLNSQPIIKSWDIIKNNDIYKIGDNIHHYYRKSDNIRLPLWGYGTSIKNNISSIESKCFVIDNYNSFYDNYDMYMKKLGYNNIKEEFRSIILELYPDCYELCIFNKKAGQIFVMYNGLSNEEFIDFLQNNNYPLSLIEYIEYQIENDQYHLYNEIAIIYNIKTKKIIRTGWYGMI